MRFASQPAEMIYACFGFSLDAEMGIQSRGNLRGLGGLVISNVLSERTASLIPF